ncbi:hypothetical protein GCM10010837_18580 [Aminobacter niigataensis]
MFSFAGMSVPIASVESDTSLTLAYPWPDASAAGAYAIARETSEAVRAAWINDRLAQILTKLSLAGIHPDGAGTLAERDALSPVPAAGFLWLRVEIGYGLDIYKRTGSGWDGPFSLTGPAGPGGTLHWVDAGWAAATAYEYNDGLVHDGTSYRCFVPHTSAASTEPGVGANWATVWEVTAAKGADGAPGAPGVVQSVVAGSNVTVDSSDPAHPVISSSGGGTAASIVFTPAGNVSATNVQTAIQELDGEKANSSSLGTAAAKNVGTSGDVVPLLNTDGLYFDGKIGIGAAPVDAKFECTSSVAASNGRFVGTTALGSSSGGGVGLVAAGNINAADQRLGIFFFGGQKSSAYNYGAAVAAFSSHDWSAGAGAGTSLRFETATTVGNSRVERLRILLGLFHPSATGGDKGDNTINFGAVYDDNSLLTCMAMSKEFIENGEIDIAKWDAMVPDIQVPESREDVPVMVDRLVPVVRALDEVAEDGGLVRRFIETYETVTVQAADLIPVWDENGNGISVVEHPLFEEVVTPATIVPRIHGTARIFKAMCDAGFDPRDPEQYFAKMRAEEALPGMPTQADWEHNGLSIGELASRKWLAMEMVAVVCNAMWLKLKDHESRLAALETPSN